MNFKYHILLIENILYLLYSINFLFATDAYYFLIISLLKSKNLIWSKKFLKIRQIFHVQVILI